MIAQPDVGRRTATASDEVHRRRRRPRHTLRLTAATSLVAAVVAGCGAHDAAGAREGVRADSLAELHADSVVRRAAREDTRHDSLLQSLTPPPYAHDTAFAASVLAEERALTDPACELPLYEQGEADVDLTVRQKRAHQLIDLGGRSLEGTPLWRCVEDVLRRTYPLRTAADRARDSTRLAVRERFRRAVYAQILLGVSRNFGPDTTLAIFRTVTRGVRRFKADAPDSTRYTPPPGTAIPVSYDVGRAAYHFQHPPRVDPEPADTMP